MAVKFLDNTGLGYFWSKIKAWCNATFAAITHNQASNTINAMTGYSKPNSGSAIATSDNLNSAIGKLEAKVDAVDDSNYVHKTGDETIEGTKRFKPNYVITSDTDAGSSIVIKSSSYSRTGTSIKRYNWFGLYFEDKDNNSLVRDTYNYFPGRVGCLEHFCDTQGITTYIRLLCSKGNYSAGTADEASTIIVGFDSNGTKFARAPSTSENRSHNEDIITRDWIPKDTRIVHTTGNESIAGDKTFTYNMFLQHPDATRGTAPSSNLERDLYFYDSIGNKIAAFGSIYYTDKSSRNAIYAYNTTVATGNNIGYLGIGCDKDGNVFTHAPTPATSSNDTNIATTAFVKAQGYVTANDKVKQVSGTGNLNRPILLRFNGNDASETSNYAAYNDNVFVNTSNGTLWFTGSLVRKNLNFTKGTNPSATHYWTFTFCDKDGGDYTNNCIGMLETSVSSTGLVSTYLRAIKNTAASSTNGTLSINYDTANDYAYATCPTPAANSNSTSIATTAWVRTATGNTTLNAANVTGTVAIANGGTGATTRLNAVKALTNENVGTDATAFLTITNSWGKAGYTSVANAKAVLGLGTAAYTASIDYVKTTGNQTNITGSKYFNDIAFKSTSIVRNTFGAEEGWKVLSILDNNNATLASLSFIQGTSSTKEKSLYFRIYNKDGTQYWFLGQKLNSDNTSSTYVNGKEFYPTSDNTATLGLSNRRWKVVYAATGSINTSDERYKSYIKELPDEVLDAWDNISWKQFKFNDSIEEKGENARIHTGLIAQQVKTVFETKGINADKYGFFCYDKWDEVLPQLDEKGNIGIKGTPAGDKYSLRYEEALCIEAAYQRRKNKILENRISELEKRLAKLEGIM